MNKTKIDSAFSEFLIKEYQHWNLYLHQTQDYLGRCVIWCKREDAVDLSETTPEEQVEFFAILPQVKLALTKSFQPDVFNYAFLGNKTKHLHCHVVPRYAKARDFAGTKFEDKEYGENYRTHHDVVLANNVLLEIKNILANNL